MQIAIKPAAGRILVHIRNWKVLVCTWSLTLLPSIKILKYLVKSLLIHFPFHDLIGRVRMERGEVDCYPKEKIKFLWEVGLLLFFKKKKSVFSWDFLIPILHDLLCQSNKKTISTRNLSISGVAFTMTILHSALSRLWKICNLGGIRTFHFAFSKLRLHFKIAVIIFRWCDHKYNLGHVSLLQRYNCCTIFFK